MEDKKRLVDWIDGWVKGGAVEFHLPLQFPAWVSVYFCCGLGCTAPILEALYCTTFQNPDLLNILNPGKLWDRIGRKPAKHHKYKRRWWLTATKLINPRLRRLFPPGCPFSDIRAWFTCNNGCRNGYLRRWLYPMNIGTGSLPSLDWCVQCSSCHRRRGMAAYDTTKPFLCFNFQGISAIPTAHVILPQTQILRVQPQITRWILSIDNDRSFSIERNEYSRCRTDFRIDGTVIGLDFVSVCGLLKVPNVEILPRRSVAEWQDAIIPN